MRSKMLMCAVILSAFAGGVANSGGEKQPAAGAGAESRSGSTVQAKGGDDELAKLGKGRRDAAEKAYRARFKHAAIEPLSDTIYHLSVRWLNAELDLSSRKLERIAAYTGHLQRMKDWEKKWDGGAAPEADIFIMLGSFQKEAEYWLAKEMSAKE